jgi:hypothetical protein
MLMTSRTRLREAMAELSRKAWFPQVPVSLAVALLGLLHLIPVIDQAVGIANLSLLSEMLVAAWLLHYDIVLMGFLLATHRYFDRGSMRLGTLAALADLFVSYRTKSCAR